MIIMFIIIIITIVINIVVLVICVIAYIECFLFGGDEENSKPPILR